MNNAELKSSASKIKLTSFDDLFGGTNEESVIEVSVDMLHEFKNHPFKVEDNAEMEQLVDSIKLNGVVTPIVVRASDDGYEIISGHRRKYACIKAGIKEVPVIVKNLNDDEAVLMMIDSNLQRENVLPSEKAFAYKMRMEALNHKGTKGTDSTEKITNETGEKRRQIFRYIRLTYLIKDFLDAVDSNKLSFIAGVNISYLKDDEQKSIFKICSETMKYPSVGQSEKLKEVSSDKTLDCDEIRKIMSVAEKKISNVTIREKQLRKYFPSNYSKEEIENIILSLLEEWKANKLTDTAFTEYQNFFLQMSFFRNCLVRQRYFMVLCLTE